MSAHTSEPTVRDRLGQRPALDASKIKDITAEELGLRFLAGALVSILSGALTLAFGPRVGGVLLAAPAIMAATLTLIAREEDAIDAREDARGAIVGACALTLFAAVAAMTLGHLAGGLALLAATIVWVVAAVLGYVILWWR